MSALEYKLFPKQEIKSDTTFISDTVYKTDTLKITIKQPVERLKYIIRTDTFKTKDGNDTIINTEHKHYIDSICKDRDTVIVQNYITGSNARLDSTLVELRKQKEIINNSIIITKEKHRRITYGIQVGMGYGMINHKPDMFIGIGLQYNF